MKRAVWLLVAAILVCASGWAGSVTATFSVNPQGTFLYQSSNDSAVPALFINLTGCTGSNAPCINAQPGSTLQIVGLGEQCLEPTGGVNCFESGEALAGAFDTNNVLLASSSLNPAVNVDRLTGTVNAAGAQDISNVSYYNTYFGNVNTTIPNDFVIPSGMGITLVVPVGAQYLVIGALDSFFGDNTDPLGNLAVQLTDTVPEPVTMGLFGAGLVAFALVRRYRGR